MLIFYADKVLVMGHSGNSSVFNVAIVLKSRILDAHEMFMLYSNNKLLLYLPNSSIKSFLSNILCSPAVSMPAEHV